MVVTTLEGYALKALIYIAMKDEKRATIKEISINNRVSFPYMLRICSQLRKNGLLKSIRGRTGGYVLAKDPSKISLYEIINAVGRETVEIKCDYGKRKTVHCFPRDCISMSAWKQIKKSVDKQFKNIKLSDLIVKKKGDIKWQFNKHK